MNKAEREKLNEAQKELSIARALHWSRHEALGPDLPAPKFGEKHTVGWRINVHTRYVSLGWSECVANGNGAYPVGDDPRCASQGGVQLYSSELRALQDLRHAVERQSAIALALIDSKILAAEGWPSAS